MDVIADFLIKQETITGKEFMKMFNEVRAQRDGGQALLTDQQADDTADASDAAGQPAVLAEEQTVPAAVEKAPETEKNEAEETAAEEALVTAVTEEAAAVETPAEPEEPAEEAVFPDTEESAAAEAAVEPEVSAEEQAPAETEGSTDTAESLSPEELVRRTKMPRGRYSHVSADDIFGEE